MDTFEIDFLQMQLLFCSPCALFSCRLVRGRWSIIRLQMEIMKASCHENLALCFHILHIHLQMLFYRDY